MFRIFLILALSLPELAYAHGLNLSLTDGDEAITGEVTFTDGAPLVGAAVELRPAAEGNPAATPAATRTDADGRYAFPAPHRAGEYRLIAEDGLGHRSEIVFVARGDQRKVESTPSHSPWLRWLSGLGYLVGLFGIASWWLSKRNKTSTETP